MRDRFGGDRSVRFEPSGYFRLERRDDRWWFVTPEGHAFLAFGMNHVHPGWLNQAYNARVWLERFGAQKFGDPAWQHGLRSKVRSDMALCGYNHFGVHNNPEEIAGLGYAYIAPITFINTPHWIASTAKDFLDVYSPDFESHCDGLAQKHAAPRRDDPWLLGYAFTDCPVFTDAEALERGVTTYGSSRPATPTWPRVLRNLPASAPGKSAYVACMRSRYAQGVTDFNTVYGTSFDTWDSLLAAVDWRAATDMSNARELQDNQAFLEQVVDRYYRVAVASVRRHDPNHLVLGDKLNGNTDGADRVAPIAARHTDLIFYQMYGLSNEQRPALDRWSSATGKPLFNGDGTFSTPSEMMPSPYGPHAKDQADRGALAFEFASNTYTRPDFVGWSVCGWVDTWKTMPNKGEKQHSGFFSPTGEIHEDYVRRLREISDNLYTYAARE